MQSTPPASTGRERRSHRRKTLNVAVQLCHPGRQLCDGHSFDISAAGVGLIAPIGVPVGTACNLSLAPPDGVPDGNPIELQAVVAHTVLSRGGAGFRLDLRYAEVSTPAAAALARLLKD
ncbi:MAG: PilZ domain-containing protein [Rhizobacter sp.]|nr:PilZ domain-containing protein [Rhizobacter sp.]